MMKILCVLLLGAPMIVGAATSYAATPQNMAETATPFTTRAVGSQQLPAFNYRTTLDPVVIATPNTTHATGSQQMPAFDYQMSVPVVPSSTAGFTVPGGAASRTAIAVTKNGGR